MWIINWLLERFGQLNALLGWMFAQLATFASLGWTWFLSLVNSTRDWLLSVIYQVRDWIMPQLWSARDWLWGLVVQYYNAALTLLWSTRDWLLSVIYQVRDGILPQILQVLVWLQVQIKQTFSAIDAAKVEMRAYTDARLQPILPVLPAWMNDPAGFVWQQVEPKLEDFVYRLLLRWMRGS